MVEERFVQWELWTRMEDDAPWRMEAQHPEVLPAVEHARRMHFADTTLRIELCRVDRSFTRLF